MGRIWKFLILLSLGMNLIGFSAQVVIVEKALDEMWAQLAALQRVSSDQQALRREVRELQRDFEVEVNGPEGATH